MTVRVAWAHAEGDPIRVTAYERLDRGGVVYFRWRALDRKGKPNWKGERSDPPVTLRTQGGRLIASRVADAIRQCQAIVLRLAQEAPPTTAPEYLTIGATWPLISDASRGLYPKKTAHRDEVERALEAAVRVWGAPRVWATIRRADLVALWRARMVEIRNGKRKPGHRGAEITVQRILTVARWLREEGLAPDGACMTPDKWKEKLKADWALLHGDGNEPTVHRPRYTLEESRTLLEKSAEVEPRFALLIALGAELRLGQVRRAMRSDLDIGAERFTPRGRGKKRGKAIRLTPGQMVAALGALTGYLWRLEHHWNARQVDYPLFPGGYLQQGIAPAVAAQRASVERTAVRRWWKECEKLAGIPHVEGRGAYGVRRQAVDATKAAGASREALQNMGGWEDSQVPDRIYADQQAEAAQVEAASVRARIRGEAEHETWPKRNQGVTTPSGPVTPCDVNTVQRQGID